jgi:hypothetical protein
MKNIIKARNLEPGKIYRQLSGYNHYVIMVLCKLKIEKCGLVKFVVLYENRIQNRAYFRLNDEFEEIG